MVPNEEVVMSIPGVQLPVSSRKGPIRVLAVGLPLLLLPMLLSACGKGEKGTPAPGDEGDTDPDVVLPGELDEAWADALPEGMKDPPQNAHGGFDLAFNPTLRDPVTAYADCGAWLSGCLEDRQGDFDACVASVPICQTDTPWEEGDCCPSACQADYQTAVAGGTAPYNAYIDTFALDRTCFAGLAGGEP
jgi:hypothetical protein